MALGEEKKVVFLRSKASFQIYLVLMYTLVVSISLSSPVEAQAGTGCCENAGNGNYCVPTTATNCQQGSQWSPVTCNQVSYCATGCCVSKVDGSCGEKVPGAVCDNEGNTAFFKGKSCDQINSCQKGCCQLGTEFSYKTKGECQNLLSEYYPSMDVSQAWDADVADEYTCLQKAMQDDVGCCVEEDPYSAFGSCVWTNRESCSTSGQENLAQAGSGFYQDVFCSNDNLPCACKPQSYKACAGEQDEDVYWFDSCGNREDLVADCDPFSDVGGGTLCKKNGDDASCQSVDCVDTVDISNNPQDPKIGGYRKFGESWCSYESGTGGFFDRPGSRQYRHVCINGEELIEECKDFREEICLQADINATIGAGSVATCKDLNEFPKIDIEKFLKTKDQNASFVYLGTAAFDDPELKLVSSTTVPVGQKFWSDENENYEDVEKQCTKGTSKCTVLYARKHWFDSYECKANCFCETKEYLETTNNYCKMFGDCGADLNVLGEATDGGLFVKWSGFSKGAKPTVLPDNWAEKLNVYGLFGAMSEMNKKLENADDVKDELDLQAATGFFVMTLILDFFEAIGLGFISDIYWAVLDFLFQK